jgi:SRSO17 transposase
VDRGCAAPQFREQWRLALAQVRAVLKAGFTITGVVVDAGYGTNAAFRAGLERLGLPYGVAIAESDAWVELAPSPIGSSP